MSAAGSTSGKAQPARAATSSLAARVAAAVAPEEIHRLYETYPALDSTITLVVAEHARVFDPALLRVIGASPRALSLYLQNPASTGRHVCAIARHSVQRLREERGAVLAVASASLVTILAHGYLPWDAPAMDELRALVAPWVVGHDQLPSQPGRPAGARAAARAGGRGGPRWGDRQGEVAVVLTAHQEAPSEYLEALLGVPMVLDSSGLRWAIGVHPHATSHCRRALVEHAALPYELEEAATADAVRRDPLVRPLLLERARAMGAEQATVWCASDGLADCSELLQEVLRGAEPQAFLALLRLHLPRMAPALRPEDLTPFLTHANPLVRADAAAVAHLVHAPPPPATCTPPARAARGGRTS